MTRSTTTADQFFEGRAKNPYYNSGYYGVERFHMMFDDFGAVAAGTATGVAVQQFATLATNLTATGTLATAGTATFDVGRAPMLTATGDVSAVTFTFTGTDDLGRTIKHAFVGPTGAASGAGSITTGLVAFKTITNVAVSAGWATTIKVDVGSSNTMGFKFRVADKGKVSSISQDGKPETTLTLQAALAVATTPTASTADTRGLWTPNTTPDGTKRWNALYKIDHTDDALAFGSTPFSG